MSSTSAAIDGCPALRDCLARLHVEQAAELAARAWAVRDIVAARVDSRGGSGASVLDIAACLAASPDSVALALLLAVGALWRLARSNLDPVVAVPSEPPPDASGGEHLLDRLAAAAAAVADARPGITACELAGQLRGIASADAIHAAVRRAATQHRLRLLHPDGDADAALPAAATVWRSGRTTPLQLHCVPTLDMAPPTAT